MAYRVYDVKIRREDLVKAEKILLKHWNNGDIDAMRCDNNSGDEVTYWINPYVYEDLEEVVNEFKQAGIQVL
jgi:ABC-type transport system substrate-binding protein